MQHTKNVLMMSLKLAIHVKLVSIYVYLIKKGLESLNYFFR